MVSTGGSLSEDGGGGGGGNKSRAASSSGPSTIKELSDALFPVLLSRLEQAGFCGTIQVPSITAVAWTMAITTPMSGIGHAGNDGGGS